MMINLMDRACDIKGERGEVCSIGSLAPIQNVIIRLKKIRFYKVRA